MKAIGMAPAQQYMWLVVASDAPLDQQLLWYKSMNGVVD
jgi:hypothetical protein